MTKLEDLIKFAEENPKLVQIRTDDKGFRTFKYTRKAFFGGLKQPELENLRGLVVDKNNELVTLPFPKMYNFGVEEQAPKIGLNETVVAFKKVNGFMCAVSYYEGELVISTTGTTNSQYVEYAKEVLSPNLETIKELFEKNCLYHKPNDDITLLFEILHPLDPHIIKEETPSIWFRKMGAYFIGVRRKSLSYEFNMFLQATKMLSSSFTILENYFYFRSSITTAEYKKCQFSEVVSEVARVKHEGFVIYTEDGRYTKIKSPYYLFFKYMARTKSLDNWHNKVNSIFSTYANEDFKNSIKEYMSTLNMRDFLELPEQERLQELRKYNFLGLED
jgi:hypothetical protein